jgi:hypothetical protein
MFRSSTLGRLRIAVSVACLLACATFVVLWVRSYSWYDWLVGPLPRSYMVAASTQTGQLEVLVSGPAFRLSLWELSSYPIHADPARTMNSRRQSSRFGYDLIQGRLRVRMPLWFPMLVFGVFAAVLGIRTARFSLHALLVAMTITAVVLGLAVALR